jgi:hypothetical protein
MDTDWLLLENNRRKESVIVAHGQFNDLVEVTGGNNQVLELKCTEGQPSDVQLLAVNSNQVLGRSVIAVAEAFLYFFGRRYIRHH